MKKILSGFSLKPKFIKSALRFGLTSMLLGTYSVMGQFSGYFDPSNWLLSGNSFSSNAYIDLAGTPDEILFIGNHSGAGECCDLYDEWSIPIGGCSGSGTLTFDWQFISLETTEFYYSINGVDFFVSGPSAGPSTGSISLSLNQGDIFSFKLYSYNDLDMLGTLLISNFSYSDLDIMAPMPNSSFGLPDLYASCGQAVIPSAPTAFDNCEGSIITGYCPTPFPITTIGTTTITWFYEDMSGNISSQNQVIIIEEDLTAPFPNSFVLPDVIESCGHTITLDAPTALDDCAGLIYATTSTVFPISTPGTTIVTWVYDDGNGNFTLQDQLVFIEEDLTAPVPNSFVLPDVIESCGHTITLDAPTALDNCAGLIYATTSTVFPISTPGTTLVTWVYDDGNGNFTLQDQLVFIEEDLTAPVPYFPFLPDIVGTCGSSISLVSPFAEDDCAGTINGETSTLFPITTVGTTVIEWVYDDGNGNISLQYQSVTIESDITAPSPNSSVLANITETCGNPVTPGVPTALDNCSGLIYGTTSTPFPITAIGTTTITWVYDDGNGNITTQAQNVIISVDTEAPVPNVTTLSDLSGSCSVNPSIPTATDNCSGTITATTTTSFPITAIGTTLVVWEYVDNAGNVSSQTQTIVVNNPLTLSATTSDEIFGNDGAIDLSITGATGIASIDWDNNGLGDTNDPEDLTDLTAGVYTVYVESDAGCSAQESFTVNSQLGVNELSQTISIYPNPTNGLIFIQFENRSADVVQVVSVTGQVVAEHSIDMSLKTLDLSTCAPGMYLLYFKKNGEQIAVQKVTIQ